MLNALNGTVTQLPPSVGSGWLAKRVLPEQITVEEGVMVGKKRIVDSVEVRVEVEVRVSVDVRVICAVSELLSLALQSLVALEILLYEAVLVP